MSAGTAPAASTVACPRCKTTTLEPDSAHFLRCPSCEVTYEVGSGWLSQNGQPPRFAHLCVFCLTGRKLATDKLGR